MIATLIKLLIGLLLWVGLAIVAARIVFALPRVQDRIDSTALDPADVGPLAATLRVRARGQEGKTGIAMLRDGADAFAARIMLADAATTSIDAQYYIWHDDLTGYLLLDALARAAERGVRVRLLLDDNGTSRLDAELAELDAHPNAEVRLYNPFNLRRFKLASYAFDFFRLNRRMHNKSFTVDGRVTILGGRNIGDGYFGTGPAALYVDLDALAVGRVVPEVSADFDRYWAAPCVHPVGPILGQARRDGAIEDGLAHYADDPQLEEYLEILEGSEIVTRLSAGDLDLEWTGAALISDSPAKGEGAARREDLLSARLLKAVARIESRFDGISPYFVPGRAGARAFKALRKRGVSVRMLTNSLEATDVLPVHAGYTSKRGTLLRRGVKLYELRRKSASRTPADTLGRFGSSGASLHAKTFAVDGKRIFVGSFNFDPRSTMLNTEMGLLIESAAFAGNLHDAFDRELDGLAWRVEMDGLKTVWIDPESGEVTRDEPGTTFARRVVLRVIGWLPVEWLL